MLGTGELHQLLVPSRAHSKAQPLWVHTAGATRVRTEGWQKQARECPGRGLREASAHRSSVRTHFNTLPPFPQRPASSSGFSPVQSRSGSWETESRAIRFSWLQRPRNYNSQKAMGSCLMPAGICNLNKRAIPKTGAHTEIHPEMTKGEKAEPRFPQYFRANCQSQRVEACSVACQKPPGPGPIQGGSASSRTVNANQFPRHFRPWAEVVRVWCFVGFLE